MDWYFMEMHQDLVMWKVLQSTTFSAEFIGIPANNKFDKEVSYIHNNKSWERWYLLLKIIFSCLRVLWLADSNHSGMDKVYYSSRMTKQRIEITIFDIDYQELLPDIS